MTTEELNIKLTAQSQDFENRMRNAENEFQNFKKAGTDAMNSVNGVLKTLKAGLATLGIGAFIRNAQNAYTTQMENERKLETVMRQRLGASNAEIQSVKDLASAQQKLGIIGDEVQLAGAQQLATYTRETETIKTLIPAMNDLMAQQNGYNATVSDATGIANLMGKALQGQTSALTRAGISFSEAQEQVLKYGNESEKAAMLAKVITDNIGNMNEALRDTPTGSLTALRNDLGDAMEEFGATFQPIISSFMPLLTDALTTVKPIVLDVSKGVGIITSALNDLSPEARKAIVYIGGAAVMLSVLNATMGGTLGGILALGIGALAVLGNTKDAVESTIADVDAKVKEIGTGAYDSLSDSANEAEGAVDDMNDSISDTNKQLNRLAGFDEITKLGGGSNGTKAFGDIRVGAEEAKTSFESLQEAYNRTKNDIEGNGISLPSVGTIDFSGVKARAEQDIYALSLLFSGDDNKILSGLRILDENIKGVIAALFGQEFADQWDSYWQGLGSELAKAITGAAGESDVALVSLQHRIQETWGLFGEIGTQWGNDLWKNFSKNDPLISPMLLGDKYDQLGAEFVNDFRRKFNENVRAGFSSEMSLQRTWNDMNAAEQYADITKWNNLNYFDSAKTKDDDFSFSAWDDIRNTFTSSWASSYARELIDSDTKNELSNRLIGLGANNSEMRTIVNSLSPQDLYDIMRISRSAESASAYRDNASPYVINLVLDDQIVASVRTDQITREGGVNN